MDPRRLVVWSGVAGGGLALVAVLVATVLSPTFAWPTSALSDLGAAGAPTRALFNYGLVVSGLLALPFVRPLLTDATHPLEGLGGVAFGASMVALSLVGLFPTGTRWHFPAAFAYFLATTVTLWVHGTGTALAGDVNRGLFAVWLGIVHLLSWVLWAAGLRLGPGLAVPEMVGSVLLFVWALRTTLSLPVVAVELPGED
jgi:hypothetical membrane protein